jgi:hypothetical protein
VEANEAILRGGARTQATKELFEWYQKWGHTQLGEAINNIMSGRRRPRGAAFNVASIMVTVALLEKIGMTGAAAKKQAAERFHTTLRNVQLHVRRGGASLARQLLDLAMADFTNRGAGVDWANLPDARLTPEERQKLDEITREK